MLGVAETMGCIIGAMFIRSIGKRPLVFTSLIGNGLCFFSAAVYSYYVIIAPETAVVTNHTNIVNDSAMIADVMPSLTDSFDIVDSSRAVRSLYHMSEVKELPSILTDDSGITSKFIEDALLQMNPQNRSMLNMRTEKDNNVWMPTILLVLGSLFAHMGIKMIPWMLIGEVSEAFRDGFGDRC